MPPNCRYRIRPERGGVDDMNKPTKSETALTALQEELQNFHRFAEAKLHTPGYESLEELLGLWRANHPVAKMSPSARSKESAAAKPDAPKKDAVPYL